MLAAQKAVHSGEIGDVHAVYSDHSSDIFTKKDLGSRLLAAELAGGPLMDIGPYPMVWVCTLPRPKLIKDPDDALSTS